MPPKDTLIKERELYRRNGQLQLLYKSLPTTVVLNIIVSLILPLIFGNTIPLWSLYTATCLILFSALLRGVLYIFYRVSCSSSKSPIWRILYITGFLLTAISWGITSILLFPGGYPIQQALLIMILAGVSSAAIVNLSADFTLSVLFIQLILTPLIVRILLAPSEIQTGLILMILSFNIFLLASSYILSLRIKENLITEYNFIIAEKKLKMSEQRFEWIFNQAPTGIFYYSADMVLLECNRGFSTILKTPEERLKGLKLKDLHDNRVVSALEKVLKDKNGYYDGPYDTTISGEQIFITLRTSPVRDSSGLIKGGVAIVEDITEKTRIQQEIHHQAYHDSLTGLPNRQLLLDRLSQALKSAHRHTHKGVILYLDLDKFKLVNDSMGHQTGDILLKEVAARLTAVLRKEDTISRIGGDEFIILLPEIILDEESSVTYTRNVAEKIHHSLTSPFRINEKNFHISTSIGAVIFNGDEEDPQDVLKYADTAMYHAKDQGRNQTSFFHNEMDAMMQEQVSLESDLREAMQSDGLKIFLQPIIDIPKNHICGAEALLRWFHPEKGFISPEKIIKIAENTGQIIPLGKWIMEKSLSIYADWIKHHDFLLDYISINISIKQMLQQDFVDETIICIKNSAIPPERIVLEITESILITDFENTVKKMKMLREFGVQFALDDFGTGYSSLSYLKKLPLDKLKIDRAFTENLLSDKDDYALVETIMSIAEHFNLKVITEGVEEAEQITVLKKMKCPYYQGYFCSKPLPPEEFLKLVLKKGTV